MSGAWWRSVTRSGPGPLVAALVSLMSASAAANPLSTITFASFPDGTPVMVGAALGAQYGGQGVIFYPDDGLTPLIESSANAPSPPFIAVGPGYGIEFANLPLTITFDPPVSLVQFAGGTDCDSATGTLTAYDVGGMPLGSDGPHALVSGRLSQIFNVPTTSDKIVTATFVVDGPGGPDAITGCDQLIDDLSFGGSETPTSAPPPSISLTSPVAGNANYDATALVAAGTVSGTNLYSLNIVVTPLNPPPGGGGPVAALTSYFPSGETGTSIPISFQLKQAGQLPIGGYTLTATVTDLLDQEAQAVVTFSNAAPAAVTNVAFAPGGTSLGPLQYGVMSEDCELVVYQGGAVAYEPSNASFHPLYVPTPIEQKWVQVDTLAFPPPVFYPFHGLGCPVATYDTELKNGAATWLIQQFERGGIYVPTGGAAVYVPKLLTDPLTIVSHGNVYGNLIYYVGAPVSDPVWELDANNPTWIFQRFDQNNSGPAWQNTVEIRGRSPVLYLERIGGDFDELSAAQADSTGTPTKPPVISGLTPTIWQQFPCSMGASDSYPTSCDLSSLQPTPTTGAFTGTTSCPNIPLSCDVSCKAESACTSDTFMGLEGGAPEEWVDLPDADVNYAQSILYHGIVRNLDVAGPDQGSHLANVDYLFDHQFCATWNSTLTDLKEYGTLIGAGAECAVGGFLNEIDISNSLCDDAKSDVSDTFAHDCRADWNLHTRPLQSQNDWQFVAVGNYEDLGTADMEIEFEAEVATSDYSGSGYFTDFTPAPGDLLSVHGRHIVDCGHCPFKSEIHPPDMLMVSRSVLFDAFVGLVFQQVRGTDVYVWGNGFLPTAPVMMTAYASPRPSLSARLVVQDQETGYYVVKNGAVANTTQVWNGMQVTATGNLPNFEETEGDDGIMYYPAPGIDAEYIDHWQISWDQSLPPGK